MRTCRLCTMLLAIVAGFLCASSCTEHEAGSFEVIFEWVDPAPGQALWVLARIEQRVSANDTAPVTIAEAPLAPYTQGTRLAFDQLPYGSGYVVVVEMKEAPEKASRTLFHGESERFTLAAGKHVQVAVRLHLCRTPQGDPDGAVVLVEPVPLDGVIATNEVTLGLSAEHASRVVVANDQAFSMGRTEARLDDLEHDSDRALWPGWDLDAGLCDTTPCPDGPRRVYVRFLDDQDYASPVYSTQTIVDRAGPIVTGASLVREPFFAPAIDDGITWFSSLDPHTGEPVRVVLWVYADEPLAEGASLAATGPAGTVLDFIALPEESRLDSGIAAFEHILASDPAPPDGDYDFQISWTDALGNAVTREVPWILRLRNAPPTGTVDRDATVFLRAPWGDDTNPGEPRFSLEGTVEDPGASDVAEILVLSAENTAAGYQLGACTVDDGGRFAASSLSAPVAARVYLAPVARSGSIGSAQGVRWSGWIATLGREAPGSDHPNPHACRGWPIRPAGLSLPGNQVPEEYGHAMLSSIDSVRATTAGAALWRETTSNLQNPAARNHFAMAYDSARDRVVLFGGDMNPGALAETWEWNGTNWDRIFPATAPAPRNHHAMVYDSARAVVVLFGGTAGSDETWEWNGAAWTRRGADEEPPGRTEHAMAYDSARGRTVLFGGEIDGVLDGSTWEYNGSVWIPYQPDHAPAARKGHVMAYDADRGLVILFGGETDAGPDNELWEWNGQDWNLRCDGQPADDVCPDAPVARTNAAAAFDRHRGVLVLAGGTSGGDETWEWNGTSWNLRCGPSEDTCDQFPPVETHHAFAYDSARGRVVCFGSVPNDPPVTWVYDGTRWLDRTPAGPVGLFWHAMACHASSGKIVLFGGQPTHGSASDETWEWDGGWQQSDPANRPSGRTRHAMATDPLRDVVVLFGGSDGGDETWEWNGTDWNRPLPATSPAARHDHAMAYDTVRGRVLLFGGNVGGSCNDETWEWDGADWSPRLTGHGPPSLCDPAMASDLANGRIVLFGGTGDTGKSSETWVYDGSDWSLQSPDGSPPAVSGHTMAWDPGRRRVVLFGGQDAAGQNLEAMWEWDGATWTENPAVQVPPGRFWHAMAAHPGRGQIVLFGGPNELNQETWVLDHAASGPAQVLEIDLQSLGPEDGDDAIVREILVRAVAGGAGYEDNGPVGLDGGPCDPGDPCLPDHQPVQGVLLSMWLAGQWEPLASNEAPPDAPAPIEWSACLPADIPPHLLGDRLHLAVTPAGSNGTGQAVTATDYIEVEIRTCHDGPACEHATFPGESVCSQGR